jgi:pantoate--beta-alanine ligase
MYPAGFSTSVNVLGVSERWEGHFRPQFLTGVATIVAKLLLQVAPDIALFGEKDWQQLQVVSKLVTDLNISTQIVGVPTRREADGLAMSSRNAYLTVEERAIAPALKSALDDICLEITFGHNAIDTIVEQAQSNLLKNGFTAIDYLAPCHAQTLEPWVKGDPLRVLGAAWLGKTRLIDNRGA